MRLPAALLLVPLLLAACPEPSAPGDVQFGTYAVTAQRVDGGCVLQSDVEQTGTVAFQARLAADVSGGDAWLSVSQAQQAGYGVPRQGTVVDGGMEFVTTQLEDIQVCACRVEVTETLAFHLRTAGEVAESPDGGTVAPDGGVADAGPSRGPVPGLPDPDDVVDVTGSISYDLRDPSGACPEGGEACPLPCAFSYGITEGERL